MPDRPGVFVHLLPSLIPPGALAGGVAVVIDVLRATTAMVHALAAGCEAVVPCNEIDEARTVAASLPPGTALLGGERGGLPIEGFDLGNSPGDYTPEVCRGKTLVMTTTNGTRAILACLEAERVLIGAFANRMEVEHEIGRELSALGRGRPVHLVCSGTEGFISLEDTLLAAYLVGAVTDLGDEDEAYGNDQAMIAALVQQGFNSAHEATRGPESIAALLRRGRGGQNVRRIGLERDIGIASTIIPELIVPEVVRDPLRIVRAGGYAPGTIGTSSSGI